MRRLNHAAARASAAARYCLSSDLAATNADSDERLRETLRGFLRNSSSFKATADELHLHVNSVKYRVQRAIERRGKPIEADRIDVEVALLLCHWFGAAVLGP